MTDRDFFQAANEQPTTYDALAGKVLRQVQNSLYFKFKALSPAIYRMHVKFLEPNSGEFGTDASDIYADPMAIIYGYKESPSVLARKYLHMLFHCIYMHPFGAQKDEPDEVDAWNVALDICAEAASMRLDPPSIPFDGDRKQVIDKVKQNVKLFLPELVYKEITSKPGDYNIPSLLALFHMDDHLWIETKESGNNGNGSGSGGGGGKNKKKSKGNGGGGGQDSQDDQQQDGDGGQDDQDSEGGGGGGGQDGQDDQDDQQQNGGGGGVGSQDRDDNSQNQTGSSSSSNEEKKQEWADVSRQIATDLQSFNKQRGTEAGNLAQEIDYLTKDKMDYEEFLKQFAVMEEKMMVDMDSFDYGPYMHGLRMGGKKKMLLVEPLEYKETKVVKDFVIAIDTSGSCAGDLVKRFLNKTYSILKSTECFSSRVNIHIVQCDTQIQHDTKIETMEDMEKYLKDMRLYGFGGTDFRPVFQYVDELIKKKEFQNLCGLLYFTDGYGVYPTKPTEYKTAFVFLEDYESRDVPPWAMQVSWKDEDK